MQKSKDTQAWLSFKTVKISSHWFVINHSLSSFHFTVNYNISFKLARLNFVFRRHTYHSLHDNSTFFVTIGALGLFQANLVVVKKWLCLRGQFCGKDKAPMWQICIRARKMRTQGLLHVLFLYSTNVRLPGNMYCRAPILYWCTAFGSSSFKLNAVNCKMQQCKKFKAKCSCSAKQISHCNECKLEHLGPHTHTHQEPKASIIIVILTTFRINTMSSLNHHQLVHAVPHHNESLSEPDK